MPAGPSEQQSTAPRFSMQIYPDPDIALVTELLRDNALPSEDLVQRPIEFFGCDCGSGQHAIAGIEKHLHVGLLRSLAVPPAARDRGVATALVEHVEAHAARQGIDEIYLLTNTAETFFKRLGYHTVPRSAAPEAIRSTSEFADLCPDDATLMCKSLRACPVT